MQNLRAKRYNSDRATIREFKMLVSSIIYHQTSPEHEPHTRGFVCETCRHTQRLCTCNRSQEVQA